MYKYPKHSGPEGFLTRAAQFSRSVYICIWLYLYLSLYICTCICMCVCFVSVCSMNIVHPQTFLGLRRLQRVGQCCLLGLGQAQPRSTGRGVPWGASKTSKTSKTQILAHQVSWPVTLVCLPGGELAPVDFGEAQFDRVRFFGHPAFALPPYKCDYFTSFTQGTDGPPSPTVETFFDLENPTTPSPFTFPLKYLHLPSNAMISGRGNVLLTDWKQAWQESWNGVSYRVAKCHRYGRYICVKIL